ncbi:TetR family transcriptional regulator [Chitinophaga skermanii]|uniref:TetR family transcriptional regulator n=1 Tax=Chitinophaga skermanii TaxID=331697 RepID=A0A327QVC6_9BACT|nr:TetR/AcrR family transcriptional regulator [Chitinophaga skermanii]RAJ08569.1 TetR family transcriptional regulator [Chitinophaga skermanii]
MSIIAQRKDRQKKEMREGILQAAWKIVNEEGWQALSIRKIADAIEYSVPVVYTHFENKDAILLQFTKDGFALLQADLHAAKKAHRKPSKQLEAMALAYWDFAFSQKEYYQLMFGLGIPTCDRVVNVPEMKSCTAEMIEAVRDALAAGSQSEVDPMLKFHTYWSILHGLVSIQMIESNRPNSMKVLILQDAVSGFIKSLE